MFRKCSTFLELKWLKPNVMQVSEYRLLTPKRSDNSNNSFNSPQLNLRKLSYYLFIMRQSDEVGGQNGKHVCLDECHE